MNYQRVYDQIIDRAKNRILEGYLEEHHIIPKCLGGSNDKNNLVKLTAREHFICHFLLINMYPNETKLQYAFWLMCNIKNSHQSDRYIPSSRLYEYGKQLHSNNMKRRKGIKQGPRSQETREKISNSKKGKSVPKTQEWKDNRSKAMKKAYEDGTRVSNKGKQMPEWFGARISRSKKGMVGTNLGIPMKEEQKQKISQTLKGHIVSDDTRSKISQTLRNRPEVTCPHCKKTSRGSAFSFYHFDKCKNNLNK